MHALVVIDMQTGFRAADNPELVVNVLEEIRLAKVRGDVIFVLEYDGYGPTRDDVWEAVRWYGLAHVLRKTMNNGADDIEIYANARRIAIDAWKVCGINTDACVYDTVIGLALITDDPISVLLHACYSLFRGADECEVLIEDINCRYENVRLVTSKPVPACILC